MSLGSSPLTRGKPSGAAGASSAGGLIPAHAGKTAGNEPARRPWKAHPRSRGENPREPSGPEDGPGSSPLTRGKLGDHGLHAVPDGLIPAHAGKTADCGGRAPASGAHPRSRGENQGLTRDVAGIDGSSPLTRGKRRKCAWRPYNQGLIPAHAGKTSSPPLSASSARAHPRSRGENSWWSALPCHAAGSSPLTRGKLTKDAALKERAGLIPAHAGKTSWTGSPKCP